MHRGDIVEKRGDILGNQIVNAENSRSNSFLHQQPFPRRVNAKNFLRPSKKFLFVCFLCSFVCAILTDTLKVGWSVIFAFKDFWAKWVFSAFCFLGRRLPFPQINCFATRLNCNRGWRTHSQTWEKCRKCEMQTLRNAENAGSRWSCKLWAMKLSSHPPQIRTGMDWIDITKCIQARSKGLHLNFSNWL